MSNLSRIHVVQHIMHEDVFYPPHAPRTESDEYKAIHHKLVVEDDAPCLICGIRNSQLGDPSINVHGVQEMETHHFWVEWALTGAVDVEKLRSALGLDIPDLASWVDHDPNNLMVLCDRHHRHKEAGIHEVSFPVWVAQKFVRDDYVLTRTTTAS